MCDHQVGGGQAPPVCYYHQVGNQIITLTPQQQKNHQQGTTQHRAIAPSQAVPVVTSAPQSTTVATSVSTSATVQAPPTLLYLNPSPDKNTAVVPAQIKAALQVHQVRTCLACTWKFVANVSFCQVGTQTVVGPPAPVICDAVSNIVTPCSSSVVTSVTTVTNNVTSSNTAVVTPAVQIAVRPILSAAVKPSLSIPVSVETISAPATLTSAAIVGPTQQQLVRGVKRPASSPLKPTFNKCSL